MRARNQAEQSALAVESRIKLLDNEESKMKRKIDIAKRQAEKVAFAQASQEEKFQRIQEYDKLND